MSCMASVGERFWRLLFRHNPITISCMFKKIFRDIEKSLSFLRSAHLIFSSPCLFVLCFVLLFLLSTLLLVPLPVLWVSPPAHNLLINRSWIVWPASILHSLLLWRRFYGLFSSLFLDSFLLTISLYLCTDLLSSYPFFCFRVARPHLAHNLLIKCSDDFLRSLAHKQNYARVGWFFFCS